MRSELPFAARAYIVVVAVAAVAMITISLFTVQIDLGRDVLIAFAVLTSICLILELVSFPSVIDGDTSFSTVAHIAVVFMLPFPLPAIVGAAVVFAADLRTQRRLRAMVFNASNYALTLGISSLIWFLTFGDTPISELPFTPSSLLTIVAILASFYFVNVFLMNAIIAIVNRRSIAYIWLTNDFDLLLPYVCLEVIGLLLVLVWETATVLIPLLIIPAVTTYIAFEMIHRLQNQTREAMMAMADAIDQRDPYTADHSRRVSDLSVQIAEVHGMNERDIERLRIASRLHDIGKIGIGNDVLHKPGKLTDDEWELLRAHPVIGEQLLKPYSQFKHETRLVRSHHERWDGRGYPDGIRGKTIPLGARIIAVADTFDAMTTSRPYRPALSRQFAIDEIRKNALTQFDPQVVACFLQVMEDADKVRSITGEFPVVEALGQARA